MSRKIYNRLSFMAVSWLDESTLVYVTAVSEFHRTLGEKERWK